MENTAFYQIKNFALTNEISIAEAIQFYQLNATEDLIELVKEIAIVLDEIKEEL